MKFKEESPNIMFYIFELFKLGSFFFPYLVKGRILSL